MLRSFSWYRRFACALTTAHVLIFAAAPFLETAPTTGAPQSITVENAPSQNLPTRAHDAETCPACVLLSVHAAQTPAADNTFVSGDQAREVAAAPVFVPPAPPKSGFLSRAPPTSLA